jgi:hypothetical protein
MVDWLNSRPDSVNGDFDALLSAAAQRDGGAKASANVNVNASSSCQRPCMRAHVARDFVGAKRYRHLARIA